MTNLPGAVAPYPASDPPSVLSGQVVSGPVITPSAVAGPKAAAVHALGEVLKTMIHMSHYFATENLQDAALVTVDKFVGAFTTSSELSAIKTGDERAAKEDVTKRIPPGGAMQMPSNAPAIDYMKLAEAIVAVQQRSQQAIES